MATPSSTYRLSKITKSQKSATSSSTLHKLVLVTTRHIKIHGLNHYKDGMIMLLKHVDMMLKRKSHKKI